MNEPRQRPRFPDRNIMLDELSAFDPRPNSASNDPSPLGAAAKRRAKLILRIIGDMPAQQRAAFTLNRLNKMSYKEIAAEMGVSESAVEKHMMEALKTLRRALV